MALTITNNMAKNPFISKSDEMAIIALKIPGSDDFIIGQDIEKNRLVQNSDKIVTE